MSKVRAVILPFYHLLINGRITALTLAQHKKNHIITYHSNPYPEEKKKES